MRKEAVMTRIARTTAIAVSALIGTGAASLPVLAQCPSGTIREVRRAGVVVKRDLMCAGLLCPGGAPCTEQVTTTDHGGTRRFCGCPGDREPDSCRAVIITPGAGEGGGPERAACAGGMECEQPRQCVRKEESQGRIQDERGPEVFYVTCSCK
jgi:hypothetical protein